MLTYQQCSRINHYVQGSSGMHDFYSCLVTVTISLESEYGKTRQQKITSKIIWIYLKKPALKIQTRWQIKEVT